MGIDEAPPARNQLNPRFLEKTEMKLIQTVHFRPHILEQLADIGLNRIAMQAIGRCILQLMTSLRSINKQFLGNAATDHAGAADAITLHDRDPRPVSCSTLGGGKATRTGTDNNQIEW